ncbi:MAG: TetR/AcrR family transcriptional regulator [Pseudomonadota bacterium]
MTLAEFRQTRSAKKHSAILDAASALFRRDGYQGASMEDIAKTAEVSTATLYRHFASKADLFEAVATASLETLETRIDLAPSDTPLIRLETLATAYAELLCQPETVGIMRMLVAETGRNADLAERFYCSVKLRLGDVFEAAVRDLETAGLITRGDIDRAPGQLQGMIEHATLLRALILGDTAGPAAPPSEIARTSLQTWKAYWLEKN